MRGSALCPVDLCHEVAVGVANVLCHHRLRRAVHGERSGFARDSVVGVIGKRGDVAQRIGLAGLGALAVVIERGAVAIAVGGHFLPVGNIVCKVDAVAAGNANQHADRKSQTG